MKIKSNLWFENEQKAYFGKGRIRLLEEIAAHGSISKAAKAMQMSYKAAWDAVNEMNNLSPVPIVERATGGKGGGGTRLTEKGYEYVRLYHRIDALQRHFFERVAAQGERPEDLLTFGRQLTLQTSARNQFAGIVTALTETPLSCEVTLQLGGGEHIYATITQKSARKLGVAKGVTLYALIKSSWVKLEAPSSQKSAKNRLPGRIIEIEEDGDRAEILLQLNGDNTITATMDAEDFRALKLTKGVHAVASFDDTDILLAR